MAFVGAQTTAIALSTTPSFALPTHSAGDLLTLIVAHRGTISAGPGGGWVSVPLTVSVFPSNAGGVSVWTKIAGASEAAPSVTMASAVRGVGVVVAHSGRDASSPISDEISANGSASAVDAGDLDAVAVGDDLLWFVVKCGERDLGFPTSFSQRAEVIDVAGAGAAAASISLATLDNVSTGGAYTDLGATGGQSQQFIGLALALRQATGVAPPVYTGDGLPLLPALTASGAGAFSPPLYSGAGVAATPPLSAAGTGQHTAPTYAGSGALALPALSGSGAGTFGGEVYSGAGVCALPALTTAGAGVYAPPVYAGEGAVALPPLAGAGAGTHMPPTYAGAGTLALPPLAVAGAGAFTPASISGDGRLIALPPRQRHIALPARGRHVTLPARQRAITLPERT